MSMTVKLNNSVVCDQQNR